MAALNVDYIAWIITLLGAINSHLTFIFDLDYFLCKLKTSKRQGVSSLLETKHKVFDLKRNQFLECQSDTLKFLSPMLNLQSYCNFGASKNMGGLCFQVFGSLGVLGVLGVFVFKTPCWSCQICISFDRSVSLKGFLTWWIIFPSTVAKRRQSSEFWMYIEDLNQLPGLCRLWKTKMVMYSISSKLNSAFSTIGKAPADKITCREKLATLSFLCE